MGALALVFGGTAFPFLCKCVVPAAKRVGADVLEFAAPEIPEAVSGENLRTAADNVERKTLRKQSGSCSRKRTVHRFTPTKCVKKPVGREETLLQKFFSNDVDFFRYKILWQFLEILEGTSQ